MKGVPPPPRARAAAGLMLRAVECGRRGRTQRCAKRPGDLRPGSADGGICFRGPSGRGWSVEQLARDPRKSIRGSSGKFHRDRRAAGKSAKTAGLKGIGTPGRMAHAQEPRRAFGDPELALGALDEKESAVRDNRRESPGVLKPVYKRVRHPAPP